jgi:hypothetical protein
MADKWVGSEGKILKKDAAARAVLRADREKDAGSRRD